MASLPVRRTLLLLLVLPVLACGGTRDRQTSTSPRDVGPVDQGVDGGPGIDAGPGDGAVVDLGFIDGAVPDLGLPDAGDLDGGSFDAAPPSDGGGGDAGCLTFAQASQLCGFASNGAVCAFVVSCGQSSSVSQCQINCEMGTTINCYGPTDVACVASAIQQQDCAALAACGFIF